jgi:ribosomal protein S18 acetylase RimI-like enzyme
MDVAIREASINDLKTVQDMNYRLFLHDKKSDPTLDDKWPYSKAGLDYFTRMLSGAKNICLIAENEKKEPVGYVIGRFEAVHKPRPNVREAELDNIIVLETYRDKGVGTALVDHLVLWAKSKKATHIKVTGYSKNKHALEFYQRRGFLPFTTTFEMEL